MDIVTARDAAAKLGVALSTMHSILDDANVPRTGRGKPRTLPASVLEKAREQVGAVPQRGRGLTRPQMLLLAALSRSPLGASSARAAAMISSVSPTVASRELCALEERGLVKRVTRTVAEGRSLQRTYWQLAVTDPALMHAVRRVQLPVVSNKRDRSTRLPRRLYKHFWNADPSALRVGTDGSFIAGRLLGSTDVTAMDWALKHVSAADLDVALSRRGVQPASRQLVENWRASER